MDHVTDDYTLTLASVPVAAAGLGAVGSGASRPFDEAVALSALWTELISGFCRVEESAFTAHSCSVVVSRGHRFSGDERAPLPERDTEILERALVEGVRKSVAADFKLCPSSVAEILRRCFAFMGLSCWPSRIPLLLVMAAHAKRKLDCQRAAKLVLAQNQQFLRQSISAVRPDPELSAWLSPAEYAVTRLLIEGKSYAEMATLRQTSKRTVANQLASAFHRLGISGRAELLCSLAQRKLSDWQASAIRSTVLSASEPTSSFTRVAGERVR